MTFNVAAWELREYKKMKPLIQYCAWCLLALALVASQSALADDSLSNRGNDPFFQISKAIPQCPTPLGPLETEQEWLAEGHYRIERGNSCWVEGRCRLSNAYRYDAEIAEAVQRRLSTINPATHWREQSSLWLMLQRRFIYVQGCVSPGFDKDKFLSELAKTADVDQVIDNMTTDPKANPLPYKALADPLKAP
ncbi:hypothetical protein M0D69_31655 [Caballeronia sp. SEWSISQ10-4 2]|uniref:hypothetical protein n=1 Tax=Caballeronia sp. SEWSISQ10-4 2 TaxID=2937438 RepID=UPI002656E488|nr:hypothetical protein [Caballeronia sp. SEWSISQ10-4 2]MDN7182497.1 hypothetical protein [Caballeronia sp. SEWSISQ10-4 2]